MAFDRRSVETFHYEGFELDSKGLLSCRYGFGPFHFCETITVGPEGDLGGAAAQSAARLVYLLAGISYYKAVAAPMIDFGDDALTDAERVMLRAFYIDGLGEYAYKNDLDLTGLELRAPRRNGESTPARTATRLNPDVTTPRPLIPFGGGLDSIVTVESLRPVTSDAALFIVSRGEDRFDAIENAVGAAALPVVRAGRSLDPQIFRSREVGFLNGHVPITGIISAIAVLAAVLEERDAVVMSNEWSASEGNIEIDGRSINHQFSKSVTFEGCFALLSMRTCRDRCGYFSLLRAQSELRIAQLFAQLTPYHRVFRSCNRAFHLDRAQRLDHWCGVCDKCCFIDLILSPFLAGPRAGGHLRRGRTAAERSADRTSSAISSAARPTSSRSNASARSANARPRWCSPPPARTGATANCSPSSTRNWRPSGQRSKARSIDWCARSAATLYRMTMRPQLSWADLARPQGRCLGARCGRARLAGAARRNRASAPVSWPTRPPWPLEDSIVLAGCDVVVKSPGISRYRPEARALVDRGVVLVGGTGLWLSGAPQDRVIVVTGTKGKSTTTSIIGHLLNRLGDRCFVGGNIGRVPFALDVDPLAYDYWAIEVSSYQATDLSRSPQDRRRHVVASRSFAVARPRRRDLLPRQAVGDLTTGRRFTVANAHDRTLHDHAALLGGQVVWCPAISEAQGDDHESGGGRAARAGGAEWIAELRLLGEHNRLNAEIARTCCELLGVNAARDPDALRWAARGFSSCPAGSRRSGQSAGWSSSTTAFHQRVAHSRRGCGVPRPPRCAHRRRRGSWHRLHRASQRSGRSINRSADFLHP